MATHRLPIMGAMTVPDATGECYMAPIDVEMAGIGTFLGSNLVMVLKDPTADTGFYGTFMVPKNYVDTANIVPAYLLDGTVGATDIGFEFSYLARASGETIEAAWQESVAFTEQSNNHADEDYAETSAALTDGNFTVDDLVFYYMKRDQSADAFNGDIHVTGLFFEYNDA